jgi:uncharacterized protein
MNIPAELQQKYRAVQVMVSGHGRLAVAFSGGVDSSLLLKIAHDTLGDKVLALFADSVVQPEEERQAALDTAKAIGASLEVVDFDPLSLPEFVANPIDRCYHCKKSIFSTFLERAGKQKISRLADGTNLDDLSQDRPGARALSELGVVSPLAEAGLTKEEIRELSRALGLPTWDRHSASCLATRIPANTPITVADLELVDKAERFLHQRGYYGCRVRLADGTCYLELAAGDIARMASGGDFVAVRDYLYSLGAGKVFLDLLERASILSTSSQGVRMNE